MKKDIKYIIGLIVGILIVGFIAFGYIAAFVKMVSSDDVHAVKSKVVSTSNSSRITKSKYRAVVHEQALTVAVDDMTITFENSYFIKRYWPYGSELVIYELNGNYAMDKFDLFYDKSRAGIDLFVVIIGALVILINSGYFLQKKHDKEMEQRRLLEEERRKKRQEQRRLQELEEQLKQQKK